jgi:hypothetical protein
MEQSWEQVADDLGLEIIEWGVPGVRKKPVRLGGTVNGFEMTVLTHERDFSGKTSVTDYVVSFAEPIGPSGFGAVLKGRMGWKLSGGDAIRRVGDWALTSDDPEALESWLLTPLPNHLTSLDSKRGAVFEQLAKVSSNTLMTSRNLTMWWMTANELKLQRGVAAGPGAFASHVETIATTAEALSI